MRQDGRIRVLVVDDHPVVRDGIGRVLEHFDQFDVAGLAGDGDAAVRLASELRPAVIVMDVLMPGKSGVDACREIMELIPDARVLMLTASSAPGAAVDAIAAGARGFLLKDLGVDELVETVREIAAGSVNLTADALRRAAMLIGKDPRVSRFRAADLLTPSIQSGL